MRGLLVYEDESINELAVVDSTAELLGDMEVAEINVGVGLLVNDTQNSINCHRGEQVGVLRDDLAAQGCDSILNKLFSVVKIHWLRHVVNNFDGLDKCYLEAVRDGGGVNALSEELLTGLEERASHDDY